MTEKLILSSSPHFKTNGSTRRIMASVLICLLPAVAASCAIFGMRSLLVVAFCASVCVVAEYLCRLVMKRKQTIGDLSAAVTGVLLALTLPPEINLAYCLVGCIAAIVVVKQMFGGIGCNFVNPAIVGRIIMLVSFPSAMTEWTYDGVTTATPLTAGADIKDLLLGTTGGSLGETCAIALIVGGIALIALGVIRPVLPVCFIGTVALMSLICGKDIPVQILGGGLLLGAFFMATDYTTSPLTDLGKAIYAVGCGFLTCAIRFWANLPEGVSYAIMIMNIVTPLIDRYIHPTPFGEKERKKKLKLGEAAKK